MAGAQQAAEPVVPNLCSPEAGCAVAAGADPAAASVLASAPDQVFASRALPATLEFAWDVARLRAAAATVRTFGWFCWRASATNPSVVRLSRAVDGGAWEPWATVTGMRYAGIQLYEVPALPAPTQALRVRVEFAETFAPGQGVEVNTLFLHEENVRHIDAVLASLPFGTNPDTLLLASPSGSGSGSPYVATPPQPESKAVDETRDEEDNDNDNAGLAATLAAMEAEMERIASPGRLPALRDAALLAEPPRPLTSSEQEMAFAKSQMAQWGDMLTQMRELVGASAREVRRLGVALAAEQTRVRELEGALQRTADEVVAPLERRVQQLERLVAAPPPPPQSLGEATAAPPPPDAEYVRFLEEQLARKRAEKAQKLAELYATTRQPPAGVPAAVSAGGSAAVSAGGSGGLSAVSAGAGGWFRPEAMQ